MQQGTDLQGLLDKRVKLTTSTLLSSSTQTEKDKTISLIAGHVSLSVQPDAKPDAFI